MFDKYFDVYLADTPKSKEKHYHIRYQVYCDEMGFEDKKNLWAHQESDQWDERAVHFLVRHRETGQWIGAMRIVFKENGILPLQEFCSLDHEYDKDSLDIEISRLCLIKDIRRRKTDDDPPLGLNTRADLPINDNENITALYSRRQINRSIIWGLFRAASLYSSEHRIDNWYFLGTKALARIISREGFKMMQAGAACDHRGKRYPYRIELPEILDNTIWSTDFKKGYRLFSELEASNSHREQVA